MRCLHQLAQLQLVRVFKVKRGRLCAGANIPVGQHVTLSDPLRAKCGLCNLPHPAEGRVEAGAGGLLQSLLRMPDGVLRAVVSRSAVVRQRVKPHGLTQLPAKITVDLQLSEGIVPGLLLSALRVGNQDGQLQSVIVLGCGAAAIGRLDRNNLARVPIMLKCGDPVTLGRTYPVGTVKAVGRVIQREVFPDRPQRYRTVVVRQKQFGAMVMRLGERVSQIKSTGTRQRRKVLIGLECLVVQLGGFNVIHQGQKVSRARGVRQGRLHVVIMLHRQTAQCAWCLRVQRPLAALIDKRLVTDSLRRQPVRSTAFGQHQGVGALAIRHTQAPPLGLVKVYELRQ